MRSCLFDLLFKNDLVSFLSATASASFTHGEALPLTHFCYTLSLIVVSWEYPSHTTVGLTYWSPMFTYLFTSFLDDLPFIHGICCSNNHPSNTLQSDSGIVMPGLSLQRFTTAFENLAHVTVFRRLFLMNSDDR